MIMVSYRIFREVGEGGVFSMLEIIFLVPCLSDVQYHMHMLIMLGGMIFPSPPPVVKL